MQEAGQVPETQKSERPNYYADTGGLGNLSPLKPVNLKGLICATISRLRSL